MNRESPEILSNMDIVQLCRDFNIPLNACCSKDELEYCTPRNGGYIINLEDSGNGGTHWVALYIFYKDACYCDSFGQIYPIEIKKFTRDRKLIYNRDAIQNLNQDSCGWYCIDFLHHMANNAYSLPRTTMNRYIASFNDDTTKNDNILQQHIQNIARKEKL